MLKTQSQLLLLPTINQKSLTFGVERDQRTIIMCEVILCILLSAASSGENCSDPPGQDLRSPTVSFKGRKMSLKSNFSKEFWWGEFTLFLGEEDIINIVG